MCLFLLFILIFPRTTRSTLFPYTTLFRSPLRSSHPCEGYNAAVFAPMTQITQARKPHVVISADQIQKRVRELARQDRKSTRLNSSHVKISYAVLCLKKKNNQHYRTLP